MIRLLTAVPDPPWPDAYSRRTYPTVKGPDGRLKPTGALLRWELTHGLCEREKPYDTGMLRAWSRAR